MISLEVTSESWPIAGTFTISRGSKTQADVVFVELQSNGFKGRGECVPYARYNETTDSVREQIEALRKEFANGLDRHALQSLMPAGAARNAVDCALWDLEAKQSGKRAWELAGIDAMRPCTTAYTLSLDTPLNMQKKAAENAAMPLLKLKLSGPDDLERVAAVRRGSPEARIIVDANEGWTEQNYNEIAPELQRLGVVMIEQPMPAGDDAVLANMQRSVMVCADESCHDTASLDDIIGKYDMINIKLDKTGGLTEALRLAKKASDSGLRIMTGCMVATSLSMAPAMIIAQLADIVDLDGPLLLAKDRDHGIPIQQGIMTEPSSALWG